MKPTLVAIKGPLRGRSFGIDQDEFTIGRDIACSLSLDDPALSRKHCMVRRQGPEWLIEDLESHNGTLLNQAPAKAQPMRPGDEIRIGQSVFLVSFPSSVEAAESVQKESTRSIVLSASDSVFLQIERLPKESILERDLAVLFRLAREAASLSTIESFRERVPRLIAGAIACESAHVHFLDAGQLEHPAGRRAAGEIAVVLDEGATLFAPLCSQGQPVAVLQLEAGEKGFRNSDMQVMIAAGVILSVALENILHLDGLRRENQRLREQAGIDSEMIAESPAMHNVLKRVLRTAGSEATVLVLGESGTGKELVSRAIHDNSRRAKGPFVAINCAALSEHLLESEMFGHEKGAFTGAIAQKPGKVELAQGGTLFLDELGDMPPSLQAKLLRMIQQREFQRVGGTTNLRADIRLIGATNKDLEKEMRAGRFRQDLYYRLNVITLVLPPLRERREDILPLANHFTARYASQTGRRIMEISSAARSYLLCYDWPGNIRELENAIERAVVMGSTEQILPEDLPESILETPVAEEAATSSYHASVQEAKRKIVLTALDLAGGVKTEAARLLGINPTYLSRLIRALNLRAD